MASVSTPPYHLPDWACSSPIASAFAHVAGAQRLGALQLQARQVALQVVVQGDLVPAQVDRLELAALLGGLVAQGAVDLLLVGARALDRRPDRGGVGGQLVARHQVAGPVQLGVGELVLELGVDRGAVAEPVPLVDRVALDLRHPLQRRVDLGLVGPPLVDGRVEVVAPLLDPVAVAARDSATKIERVERLPSRWPAGRRASCRAPRPTGVAWLRRSVPACRRPRRPAGCSASSSTYSLTMACCAFDRPPSPPTASQLGLRLFARSQLVHERDVALEVDGQVGHLRLLPGEGAVVGCLAPGRDPVPEAIPGRPPVTDLLVGPLREQQDRRSCARELIAPRLTLTASRAAFTSSLNCACTSLTRAIAQVSAGVAGAFDGGGGEGDDRGVRRRHCRRVRRSSSEPGAAARCPCGCFSSTWSATCL